MKTSISLDKLHFSLNEVVTDTTKEQKTFTGIAYSGLPIMNHPHWGNLIFDTTNISSNEKIPVLFNHDPNMIVGFGTIRTDKAIFIEGTFSNVTEKGKEVQGLMEEGFPMKESVYIEPAQIRKVPKGQKFTANGQDLVGPFTVFHNSVIKEVSMTPLPADNNTSTHMFNDRLKDEISIDQIIDGIEKMEQNKEIKEEEVTTPEGKVEEKEMTEQEIKITEEEKKFSELVESGDLTGAFKFACGCGGSMASKEESKKTSSILQDAYDKLKKEFDALKSEMNKKQRFSQIEQFSVESGIKFSGEAMEALSNLDEAELTKVFTGSKVMQKKVVNPALFSEKKTDVHFEGLDMSNAKSIQESAKKFAKERGISTVEATIELAKKYQ